MSSQRLVGNAEMKSDEKKCPYCAEVIKREASVCRFCNKDVGGSVGKGGKKGGGMLFLSLILFAVAAYIYWAPYGTLQEIKHDLKEGQADKLDQIIDYSAVRDGLKRDFRSMAIGAVEDDPSIGHKVLGILGLAIGEPVVDPVVDYVVSPAGLREVVAGRMPGLSRHDYASPDEANAATTETPDKRVKRTESRYIDTDHFVATIYSQSGSATALTFTRKGLVAWQLTHIKLIPPRD